MCALLLQGCASDSYERYDTSLYDNLKYGTDEALAEHMLLLERIIARAEENGVKPPPGVCLEYGYYLALTGKPEEGRHFMDKELTYYPESATFVSALKRLTSGEESILDDNTGTGEDQE